MITSVALILALHSSGTSHVKSDEGVVCRFDLTENMKLVTEPINGMCPDSVNVIGTWYLFKEKTDGICWYVFPSMVPALVGRKTQEACPKTLYFGGEGKEI